MLLRIMLIMSITVSTFSCRSPSESKYNPPSDHTISEGGVKHKSGLNSPDSNCVSCHGSDLNGGESGVSCHECHNKKW